MEYIFLSVFAHPPSPSHLALEDLPTAHPPSPRATLSSSPCKKRSRKINEEEEDKEKKVRGIVCIWEFDFPETDIVMEDVSAASAIKWSIELEKGLRSRRPGQSLDAIKRICSHIEEWNQDLAPTMAEYKMFGLMPGEDMLFANAILLRLADAFRLGDTVMKLAVVRVFLSELRHRRKRMQRSNILFLQGMENEELFRRVKHVFDTGDVICRALSLVLIGCWAHFTAVTAEARYLILSSLISCHDLEVKASLFAAGNFCQFSDDFSLVFLDMLVAKMTSENVSSTVKEAGARTFAKICPSPHISDRAYKDGSKMLLCTDNEGFRIALLMSLTKLSLASTKLMSEQADLLFLLLSQKLAQDVVSAVLKCLHFLFMKGVAAYVAICASSINTLLRILDDSDFQQCLKHQALCLVHKITSLNFKPIIGPLDLNKLCEVSIDDSQEVAMRVLALTVLIDMSENLKGKQIGSSSEVTPSRLISLVFDHILMCEKLLDNSRCTGPEGKNHCEALLNKVFVFAQRHYDQGAVVLGRIFSFIQHLGTIYCNGDKTAFISSKLVFSLYEFVVNSLDDLSGNTAITAEILDKMKLLAQDVCKSNLVIGYVRTICSLLLHYCVSCHFSLYEHRENVSVDDCLLAQEVVVVCNAEQMLVEKNNWPAYKIARVSACQGAWATAAFIFGYLVDQVESKSCLYWLRSMALFSFSEAKLQLLFNHANVVKKLQLNKMLMNPRCIDVAKIWEDTAWNIYSHECSVKIAKVHGIFQSSIENLGIEHGRDFYFQRWVLSLRASVIEAVVKILEKTASLLPKQDNTMIKCGVSQCSLVRCSKSHKHISSSLLLTDVSMQLWRVVQELDLIATSFMDIGRRCRDVITTFALSCSVLSFATEFCVLMPYMQGHGNFTGNSGCESYLLLAQNLIERLMFVDPDSCTTLRILLDNIYYPKRCFRLSPWTRIFRINNKLKDVLGCCRFAIQRTVKLQKEVYDVRNQGSTFTNAMRVLLEILETWLRIPFHVPKCFFQVRQCPGSEIFAAGDSREGEKIIAPQNHHLSLNICLQLKNIPPSLITRQRAMYCVLHCKTAFRLPEETVENKSYSGADCVFNEMDSLLRLNQLLFDFVTKSSRGMNVDYPVDSHGDDAYAFAQFKLNGRGQGFSSCLLDVSTFPAASYLIKWHSCCIDDSDSYWSVLPLSKGPVFTIQ